MRKINPTMKLIISVLITLIIAFQENLVLNITIGVITILITLTLLSPKQNVLAFSLVALTAVGIYFTGLNFKSTAVSPLARQLYALQLASRDVAFAGLGLTFSASTKLPDFIHSLQQQLHLSNRFAYGILASFHVLPLIRTEVANIRYSFYARGLSANLLSPRTLMPILVKSIRWSENLAMAMESKGLDDSPRTQSTVLTIHWYDWCYAAIWLILTVLLSDYQLIKNWL